MMKTTVVCFFLTCCCLCASPCGAQWQRLNGPLVQGVDWVSSSGTVLYLHSQNNNTLFRSTDTATTWQPIHCLDGVPIFHYYSNGDVALALAYPSGGLDTAVIYRSTDRGTTWQRSIIPQDSEPLFTGLGICFGSDRIYLYGETNWPRAGFRNRNLFSSSDEGATWTCDRANLDSVSGFGACIQVGHYLLAAGGTSSNDVPAIFRIDLTTLKCDTLRNGPNGKELGGNEAATFGAFVYFASSSICFRSRDTGNTWELAHGLPIGYDSVAMSGAYYSVDTGRTFVPIPFFAKGYWNPISSTALLGKTFYAATPAGLFAASDPRDYWYSADSTLLSETIYQLSVSGNTLNVLSESGYHTSTDAGTTWIHCTPQPAPDWKMETLFGPKYAGTIGDAVIQDGVGSVWHSTDTGKTWSAVQTPTQASNEGLAYDGKTLFVLQTDGLVRSTDFGKTWETRISYPQSATPDGLIGAPPLVYINFGTMFRFTSNGGVTWSSTSNAEQYGKIRQNLVADGMNLICQGDWAPYTLHRSTNRGATWTNLRQVVDSAGEYIGFPAALRGNTLVIRHYNSIDTSNDLGSTWKTVQDSLPSPPTSLVLTDQYIYAGTSGAGLWQLVRAASSVQANTREEIGIHSYPNPSSSQIYFNTQAFRSSIVVEAHVFDLLGKERPVNIRRLSSTEWVADVSILPAGVYALLLQGDNRAECKRFTVAH